MPFLPQGAGRYLHRPRQPAPLIPQSRCRLLCDPNPTPRLFRMFLFRMFLHITIPRHALHDLTMYHYVSLLSSHAQARLVLAG